MDGLKPGTPEAVQADKDKDAARKRAARIEASAARAPAPLPSMPSPSVNIPQPQSPGQPVPAPLAAPGVEPQFQWTAKDVEKITRELIELTEELSSKQISKRLIKARLPSDVVREIENDAKWAKRAKDMIEEGGAELFAVLLNKSGVAPEFRPYILLSIGTMEIAVNHLRILKRLDQLIAMNKRNVTVP